MYPMEMIVDSGRADLVDDALGDCYEEGFGAPFDFASMVGQIAQSVPNLISSIKGDPLKSDATKAQELAAVAAAQQAAAKQQGIAKYTKYLPLVALGVGGVFLVKYLKKRR
jgi:hypothetical protein